jgi:hypothetical protein
LVPFLVALLGKVEVKTQKQQNPHPKKNIAWASWIIARFGGWRIGLLECYQQSVSRPLSLLTLKIHNDLNVDC